MLLPHTLMKTQRAVPQACTFLGVAPVSVTGTDAAHVDLRTLQAKGDARGAARRVLRVLEAGRD